MSALTMPMPRRRPLGPGPVTIARREDGCVLVTPQGRLGAYPRRITERLEHWAAVAPDRTLIAKRDRMQAGAWQRITYGDMLGRVRAVGQALLDRGLSASRPVAILSGNCLDQFVLTLAALHVGVPVAPVSPSYALLATDYGKLRHCLGLLTPGLVFAQDGAKFAKAIAATLPAETEVVVTAGDPGRPATRFAD
ncbi:MAG: AMP-binding protein, partial [Roseomonas sp.]|nr:AMP-binding protein [Roseomonas sp.]